MSGFAKRLMDKEQFENRKAIIAMESEEARLKHEFKMEQLKYERESNRLFFENQMSAHRIKRADRQKEMLQHMKGGH